MLNYMPIAHEKLNFSKTPTRKVQIFIHSHANSCPYPQLVLHHHGQPIPPSTAPPTGELIPKGIRSVVGAGTARLDHVLHLLLSQVPVVRAELNKVDSVVIGNV